LNPEPQGFYLNIFIDKIITNEDPSLAEIVFVMLSILRGIKIDTPYNKLRGPKTNALVVGHPVKPKM